MHTLIIPPQAPDKMEALVAFLKALKMEFKKEKAYNPEFVAKMKRGDEDIKAGRGRTVTLEELEALWK